MGHRRRFKFCSTSTESPSDHPLEYPGLCLHPVEITFGLSRRYGIRTACDAHDWFLGMMREHEQFVVETDEAGEWPVPFFSETVQQVVVE